MLSVTTLESMPTFGNTLSGRVWFVLLPMMLFNFGVAFWMFRVGQGGQRGGGRGSGERHDSEVGS